jgi:WD40 repeat protein
VKSIIRIFISSPGDVAEEREMARQVVQSLRKRYAAYFDLQPVLWEYLPLQADSSFQQGVDLVISAEHGVDISVFILWSRLGSPLGALIRKDDGSEYRSGTEREFDLMLKAREATGGARPHLLVYTRSDEAGFRERVRLSKPEEKKELLQQKDLVASFIREEFHDKELGTNIRAYHTFNQAATFSGRLRAHLQSLLDAMCQGLRADPVWDIEEKGPPFRGLSVFDFEHADVFFGREDEIVAARTALLEAAQNGCAFLLVTGASGAGKSSLARAGILPAIVENEVDDSVAFWRKAVFSPAEFEGDIYQGVASALDRALPELADQCNEAKLASELAEDIGRTVTSRILPALKKASAGKKGAVRLIVLADQLEELFTDERLDAGKREQLGEILQALARSGEVWVVATIRGDFYARSMEVVTLVGLKADGAQIDVLPPKADAIRRMIESPAAVAGLNYERTGNATLADTILSEASNQGELLPLLQDLLEGLFRKRSTEGVLSAQSYRELGGISGALAKRAEEAFTKLAPETQAALPDLLRQLVRLDETGEETRGATKRRAPLRLFPEGSSSRSLADALVSERLLVADQTDRGDAVLTVAHETLLRVWPRVAAWIEDNREFLRQRARLSQALAEWQAQGAHDDYLLVRGLQLAQAEDLLRHHGESLSPEEKRFIAASKDKAQREQRKTQRIRMTIAGSAAGLLLLAAAGAVAGYVKNKEAQREKLAAAERQKQAEAYYDVHGARLAGEQGDFRSALAQSSKAFARHKDFTTRSALVTALAESPERIRTSITGFGSAVTAMRFGDDGALAVADAGGSLRVISFGSKGASVREESPSAGKDSPAILALTESSGTWTGWREDGAKISPGSQGISAAAQPCLLLSISEDGKEFAAVYPSSPSEIVLTRMTADGEEIVARHTLSARVSAVALGGDRRLAAGTVGGEIVLLPSDPQASPEIILPAGGSRISSLAWDSSEPARLAAGNASGEIFFFDSSGNPTAEQKKLLDGRITRIAWSGEGHHLAVARSDGAISIFSWADDGSPRETQTLRGHSGPALTLAWAPDAKTLASGGEDGAVCLWEPFGWPGPFRSLATGRDLRSLAATHDEPTIAVGAQDGTILLVNYDSLVEKGKFPAASASITSLDWNHQSAFLASGDAAGNVALWKTGQEESQADYSAPGNTSDRTVWRVKWSPNGKQLAFTSHSGAVALIEAGALRGLAMLPDYALGMAWAPDGSRLAVSSTDGKIRIIDAEAGSEIGSLPRSGGKAHEDSIGSIAYNPDGSLLASCGNDGTVAIWKSASGELAARSARAGCYLEDLAFSRDGELVYAVGADGYLRAWSAANAEPWLAVRISDGHQWAVACVGGSILSVGSDGQLRTLDESEAVWENRAHEIIGTDISAGR